MLVRLALVAGAVRSQTIVCVLGCSGSDDASPSDATGGSGSVGGTRATGGQGTTGGATNSGTGTGGVGVAGGAKATGGGQNTSNIAQACAATCSVLAETNLGCVPDPCTGGCEQKYDNVASMAACQAAYLGMLQCGATQPASSWTCYQSVIPAPTAGCTDEMNTLASQDFVCLVALAL